MKKQKIGLGRYSVEVFIPWEGSSIFIATDMETAIKQFRDKVNGDWRVLTFLERLKRHNAEMKLLKSENRKLIATVCFHSMEELEDFCASIVIDADD